MEKRIFKKIKIGKLEIENPVFLAPMEGITDEPFRIICREMGADIVFSEFIASEALIRDAAKSFAKMRYTEPERPVAVQIFGSNADVMAAAAKIVEKTGADILDLNFGCWVRKVVGHDSGAALLKDPQRMFEIIASVCDAVEIPVTVKTRLGWSAGSINIVDIAEGIQRAGAQMLSLHCRTREDGMHGNADWSYISKVKEKISIPLILNGDVRTAGDAVRAFETTPCDGVMIGRGAVGNPFIFRQMRRALDYGAEPEEISLRERVDTCLRHLQLSVDYSGFPKGMYEFRKHYSGYLKGLYEASRIRQKLVVTDDLNEIHDILNNYLEDLEKWKAEGIID